jgi:hypothetical protein
VRLVPLFSRRSVLPADGPTLPYEPMSPEGLAARWVRWVASAGPVADPIDDPTGEYADRNQPDDVWFLAGSYGRKPVERRCAVPVGRELFLPVVNMWDVGSGGRPPVPEDAFGSLTLDGLAIAPDEIETPVPFTVAGARLNGVTGRKSPFPVTVWGLWKRLPALEPGHHELHVVGGFGEGFRVDVRYHLGVAAAPGYSLW